MTDMIYPDPRHPYYIVAPPYTHTSAGVRVLHLLCHSLNRKGQTAYVMIYPSLPWRVPTTPDLLTPLLTPRVIESHFQRGLAPIVVYPEIVSGNPFNAPCVVRYVLNFPGLLGGEVKYAPDELSFGYSQVLAKAAGAGDRVLFLPATDTRIFYPPPAGSKRQGSCYFASKYKGAGGALFDVTKDSIEIKRHTKDAQSTQEVAELLRRSEVFYTYENTALATEAVLCGCPAVFLPNPHLTDIIAAKELGPEGFAWGAAPEDVARAKATVAEGAANYLKAYDAYWRDLDRFIALTQKHAEGRRYSQSVLLPGFIDTIRHTLRERGAGGTLRLFLNRVGRIFGT